MKFYNKNENSEYIPQVKAYELNSNGNMVIDYEEIHQEHSQNAEDFRKLLALVASGLKDLSDIRTCSSKLSKWALKKMDEMRTNKIGAQDSNSLFKIKNNKNKNLHHYKMFRVKNLCTSQDPIDLPRVLTCYLALPELFKRFTEIEKDDDRKTVNNKLKLKKIEKTLIYKHLMPSLFTYSYLVQLEVFRYKLYEERNQIKNLCELDIMFENNYKNLRYIDLIRKTFNENLSPLSKNCERDISLPKDFNVDNLSNAKRSDKETTPHFSQRLILSPPKELVDKLINCKKVFVYSDINKDLNVKYDFYVGDVEGKKYLFKTMTELTMDKVRDEEICSQASQSLFVLFNGLHDGACLLFRNDYFIDGNARHTNRVLVKDESGKTNIKCNYVYGSHRHLYDEVYVKCNPSNPTSPNAKAIKTYTCSHGLDLEKINSKFNDDCNMRKEDTDVDYMERTL